MKGGKTKVEPDGDGVPFDAVVTRNLKDFDPLPNDIEAQSPDEFLSNLFDLAPATFVDLLRRQAAEKTKPPLTFDDLLGRLSLMVPEFVDEVVRYCRCPEPPS